MTEPERGLTVEQALGLAATDRDALLERLHRVTPDTGWIPRGPSKWPSKYVAGPTRRRPWERWWRRWEWRCTDGGKVLASGWAPTERWAWTRADAAATRIHKQRVAEAES